MLTMYIIDVIPLVLIPRPQPQILSYFHSESLERGAVVEVPLGRRKIKAIVIGSGTIKQRKIALRKSASFELKNISRVISHEPQVSDWQFDIAKYIASYYYTPLGIALKTVLPPFWSKHGYDLNISKSKSNSGQTFLMVPENTQGEYWMKKL
ncbi:MAG: hypothetical protein ABH833_02775, partial [Parcubacteria group bacterium]